MLGAPKRVKGAKSGLRHVDATSVPKMKAAQVTDGRGAEPGGKGRGKHLDDFPLPRLPALGEPLHRLSMASNEAFQRVHPRPVRRLEVKRNAGGKFKRRKGAATAATVEVGSGEIVQQQHGRRKSIGSDGIHGHDPIRTFEAMLGDFMSILESENDKVPGHVLAPRVQGTEQKGEAKQQGNFSHGQQAMPTI